MPVISKENLRLLQDNKDSSFDYNVKMWLKKGLIIKLKNGLYTTQFFLEKTDITKFSEFVASKLIYPSYLSREYVMQQYNMLTEITYGYTSVTTNKTKTVSNKLGTYYYSFIKKELFTGYEKKQIGENYYFVATKAKALFDYLYFKKRSLRSINKSAITELRLDLEELTPEDILEFEKYLKLAGSTKMNRIYKIIRRI